MAATGAERFLPWALGVAGVLWAPRADAFTAIFLAEGDTSTQVVEHRLAIATLRDETVVWDQARWSGSPTRLAWVLPFKPGAKIERTGDAWFASLDASTQPIVYKPPDFGPAAGCALAGCNQREPAFCRAPDTINVRKTAVAGPVDVVAVSGSDPSLLVRWLRDNGFAVPDTALPAIEAYAREGYHFEVDVLMPNCGENATRTVRRVSPGAEASIAARMMSIGAARMLPITLYTLTDKRQTVAGGVEVHLALENLVWDTRDNTSNYEQLRDEALRGGSSRWLTEFAGIPERSSDVASTRVTPSIFELYPAVCGRAAMPAKVAVVAPNGVRPGPCSAASTLADGGTDEPVDAQARDASEDADAGASDAGDAGEDDAGGEPDAGDQEDAGPGELDASAPRPQAAPDTCTTPDDLVVGLRGLDPKDVHLTRLKGRLTVTSVEAIGIVPANETEDVTNDLQSVAFEDDRRDPPNRSSACESAHRHARARPFFPLVAGALALLTLVRRRRRR